MDDVGFIRMALPIRNFAWLDQVDAIQETPKFLDKNFFLVEFSNSNIRKIITIVVERKILSVMIFIFRDPKISLFRSNP